MSLQRCFPVAGPASCRVRKYGPIVLQNGRSLLGKRRDIFCSHGGTQRVKMGNDQQSCKPRSRPALFLPTAIHRRSRASAQRHSSRRVARSVARIPGGLQEGVEGTSLLSGSVVLSLHFHATRKAFFPRLAYHFATDHRGNQDVLVSRWKRLLTIVEGSNPSALSAELSTRDLANNPRVQTPPSLGLFSYTVLRCPITERWMFESSFRHRKQARAVKPR